MRRMRAEAWHVAGRLAWWCGIACKNAALSLAGVSGHLDANADSAGYWDWHTTTPLGREQP